MTEENPECDEGQKRPAAAPYDGEAIISRYIQLGWRYKWLVCIVTVLALVGTVAVHRLKPKEYEARVLIMPPKPEGGKSLAAEMAGRLGDFAGAFLDIQNPTGRHLDILKSDRALDAVIDRFGLMERYGTEFRNTARDTLRKRATFDITEGELVEIGVTDEVPETAAEMANAFVEILAEIDHEISSSKAGRERKFLEGRVAEVLKDLRKTQEEWRSFQEEHRLIRVDEGLKATATVMGELEARRIAKQVELQVLETVYAEGSPEVQTLRAEVQRLEEKLRELARTGIKSSSSGGDAEGGQWLFPAIKEVPALALEQMELERRLALHSRLYELLETQLELARITEAREQVSIEVVSPATVPDKPTGMSLTVSIMLVLVLVGFTFLLVGFVVLSDVHLARRAMGDVS